jgi:hypothetical protein
MNDPAAVAKARKFLRAGGFAEPGEDEAARLAAMGVNMNDPAAVAKARKFLRAGGFAEPGEDEAARLAAMGVNMNDPAAVAKARKFLRAGGFAEPGDDDARPSTSRATAAATGSGGIKGFFARMFKRGAGGEEPGPEEEARSRAVQILQEVGSTQLPSILLYCAAAGISRGVQPLELHVYTWSPRPYLTHDTCTAMTWFVPMHALVLYQFVG